MGREQKAGVDYFSMMSAHTTEKRYRALRQRWGNDGYAFWYILLEILGEQANLSLDCRKKINWVYLCTETRVDEISAAEILGFLSEIEAIDENLWKKHKIIWCQGFADRLKDVYKKRVRQPQKPVWKMKKFPQSQSQSRFQRFCQIIPKKFPQRKQLLLTNFRRFPQRKVHKLN